MKAELIHDVVYSARNFLTTPLTISGLEGDMYDYELIFMFEIEGASSAMRLRFNGDTGSNYRNYRMEGNVSSTSAAVGDADTEIDMGSNAFSHPSFSISCITGNSSGERRVDTNDSISGSSGNTRIFKRTGYWKNTADEITSINISRSANITSDAHIMIYRTPKAANLDEWEYVNKLDWSAETAEKSFTGLLGDTDKKYRIEWEGSQELNIEINNDSASNYTRQYMQNSGGSISSANASNSAIVTDGINVTVNIKAETGQKRLIASSASNTTASQQSERVVWYSNTATEITSLDLTPSASATGTAKLYRRRHNINTGDTLPFKTIGKVDIAGDFSAGHTFSNLKGDNYKLIKIEFNGSAAASIVLSALINADAGSNYPRQFLNAAAGVLTAQSATQSSISLNNLMGVNDQGSFVLYMYPKSGSERPMLIDAKTRENIIFFQSQWWTNTVSEITSIKISASTSSVVTGTLKISVLED